VEKDSPNMDVIDRYSYKPKTKYAREKVTDVKFIKTELTEMDWRQLRSVSTANGIPVQRLIGQVLRDFIHKL
jgi:predicted DNA binding CopG/RHH family protein